ncbi:MAG: alpha/beta hydrolase [Spirosomataceae bacterium]
MLQFVKITALAYAILLGSAVIFQKQYAFRNKVLTTSYSYHFKHQVPFEERWYDPDTTLHINALYFKTDTTKRKGLVLYFHGNADNLARWGSYAPDFTRNGYDVLIIDYPQFGKSTGPLTEASLLLCANYVYQQALKTFPENQVVVYGRSLGTGVATYVASTHHPKMLLLETPYYNLPAIGQSHLPILPFELFSKVKLHTDQWIRQVPCPLHLFHGTQDEIVPYEHSLRLAKRLGQPPSQLLTTIPHGKHKNLANFKAYHVALDSCLAN